jgi:hypothetical protein
VSRRLAIAVAALAAALAAAGCGQSTLPPFTGLGARDAGADAGVGAAPTTDGPGAGDAAQAGPDRGAASTFLVTVSVVGGPAGTSITPTTTTPGATCTAGSCRVPSGGAVKASAPSLPDWFFQGWSGSATATTAGVTLSNITSDGNLVATYINQRQQPCLDQPPANATTSGDGTVTATYTTANGWTGAAVCPWTCDPDYCSTGVACAVEFMDKISFTVDAGSFWFGGDDRTARSVGTGEGVTPDSAVTMDRFGFRVDATGFRFHSNGPFGSQPNTFELDRRDANGNIQATYTTTLPATFSGDWIFWDTPPTVLQAGVLYIFTSFLATAFTQPVDGATIGDTGAGYAGGFGYAGQVMSGDLTAWGSWYQHAWDFDFRVQQRNPACK